MQDIRTLSLNELSTFFLSCGEKSFRAKQVYEWLWKKNVVDFESMNNIPKSLQQVLKENFTLHHFTIAKEQISKDFSRKYLLQLFDNHYIEMVLIPSSNRVTVCISSQVGCAMSCRFCATGNMGFNRNLSVAEIYEQVFVANELAQEHYGIHLSNVVIMGMGEPLLNFDNVDKALQLMTNKYGMEMSPSRITLSTVGISEGIRKMAEFQPKIGLALSLHCAFQNKREQIMPISHTQNIEKLIVALTYYHQKTSQRITIEYLLLDGINDSLDDAKQLALFCKHFPIKINIIDYNANAHTTFKPTSVQNREAFIDFLTTKNILVQLRRSKGQDIDAACGQLANKNQKR